MNGRSRPAPAVAAPDPAAVLSKAVVRAARQLDLTQRDVAAALGISEATASRLFAGKYLLSRRSRKGMGARPASWSACSARSTRCGDTRRLRAAGSRAPISRSARRQQALLRSVEGLVGVVAYLDAARSRV